MCRTFPAAFVIVLYYTDDYFTSCTSKQRQSFFQHLIEYFHKHLGGSKHVVIAFCLQSRVRVHTREKTQVSSKITQ